MPILLVVNTGGRLEGNRHPRFAPHRPLANLHLALVDKFDIERATFGNSTDWLSI